MRKVALAVASVVLLGAGSAAAQEISNIGYTAGSAYNTPGGIGLEGSGSNIRHLLPEGAGQFPPAPSEGFNTAGATYNSFVNVGANAITFESSNVVSQGAFTSFESSSVVSFTFNNGNPYEDVDFHSEITPQGMGFYLADTSGGCLFTYSCAQVSDELFTFADLSPLGPGTVGYLGGSAFSFEIWDNGSALMSLNGFLALYANPDCPNGYCIIESLTGPENAEGVLTGFSQQTDPFDLSARAYGWGATDVHFALGYGEHNLEYRTSVITFANADCAGPTANICLVAYSGFGDPIGRGGAIDALNAFDVGAYTHGDDDLIGGLNFTPQTFRLSYSDGELTYATAGVPEPGTWALMIMGFGILGAALRRRHIPAHI
jgi:hypothetical protein